MRMARAARDARPAREEHLRIRGFRGQLCPSAILQSSDIFHGDRKVARGGNRRVACTQPLPQHKERRGSGRLPRRQLLNCDSIDNKKESSSPTGRESRVHPPQRRLGVGWAFLLLAPSVAVTLRQALHKRTPFPSTKRGRNKRAPHHPPDAQTPQMPKVRVFGSPVFTPSPPELCIFPKVEKEKRAPEVIDRMIGHC